MATQYSTILKLALPTQGELSGTWGDVVNDNITSMVEEAIAGRAVINTWTTNSHTLTTANGTTSESRCAMLEFTDTGTALSGAGTVICPTASKIYICKNDAGQTVTIKTSAGTGVDIADGETKFVFCDGTNVVEAVTSMATLKVGTGVQVSTILDEDNMASDSDTALATQQSIKAYVDSQVTAQDLDIAGDTGTGAVDLDSQSLTIAGTANEIETSASGQTITVGLPNAVTIADLTATTADINGGTIDGTVIGGSSAAAGTFTSITGTSANINGTVTADGLTVDGSASVKVNSGTNQLTIDNDDSTGTAASPQFTDIVFQGYLDRQRARIRGVDRASSYFRGGLTIQTQNSSLVLKDRMFVDGDGDISFYEDTGTTAKFFWDASAESLGIGTTSPASALDVAGTVTADGLTVDGNINTTGTFKIERAAPFIWLYETDVVNNNTYMINSGGDFLLRTLTDDGNTATTRINVDHATGDISFYEDTGTTPKFFWDASAESLGIGTTSPDATGLHITRNTGNAELRLTRTGTFTGDFKIYSGGGATNRLVFRDMDANSDRLTIDSSGNLLVGKSASSFTTDGIEARADGQLWVTDTSGSPLFLSRKTTDGVIATFCKEAATVGSISVTSSTTTYNITSDQRLKDNIVDAPAGNVDDIKVRSFDWKADGSHQEYGMVAQELEAVAPYAVTKGETEDDMWSVDYSKLVPMLIKEIQDLKAEVAALKGA